MKARTLLGALLLLLFTASAALAWPEGPPDKVTISGPGIKGTVEIVGRDNLEGLGPEQFFDFSRTVTTTPQGSNYYEVVRYIKGFGPSGAFDRLRYYPGRAGSSGYVHYMEAIGYGPSHHVDQWFYATAQGDATMAKLLAKVVAPTEESSAPQPENSESSPSIQKTFRVSTPTSMFVY